MVVYIICPARTYTGGPTALFQLCHALRKNSINAIMAFYGKINGNPIHPNYKKYKCPWVIVDDIKDKKDTAVITPETAINQLEHFKKVKKIIYWLSVDNFVLTLYKPKLSKVRFISFLIKNYGFNPKVAYNLLSNNRTFYYNAYLANYIKLLIDKKVISLPKADIHLAQSIYAENFLKDYRVGTKRIIMLHEPIEEEFIRKAKNINSTKKTNAVAWNGRKAYPVAFELIKMLKKRGITVFNLENVGKSRMIEVLSKTKIFLDVGIHPGRDRPPREATLLNNIVIVNNHGGCYYFDDCMVPKEFKLDCYLDCEIEYDKYAKRIEEYLNNFDFYIKKFHRFKRYILQEPHIFLNEVHKLSKILIKWGVS
jgi:hypothetical protein